MLYDEYLLSFLPGLPRKALYNMYQTIFISSWSKTQILVTPRSNSLKEDLTNYEENNNYTSVSLHYKWIRNRYHTKNISEWSFGKIGHYYVY